MINKNGKNEQKECMEDFLDKKLNVHTCIDSKLNSSFFETNSKNTKKTQKHKVYDLLDFDPSEHPALWRTHIRE